MSDELKLDETPEAKLLLNLRELIVAGKSAYGDPTTPAAQARLQEVDAKLGFMRQIGEAPPAAEPWTVERAAKERLAAEFPRGELPPLHEDLVKSYSAKFDQLDALDGAAKARLADQVAIELDARPPDFAAGMILDYRRAHGAAPSGHALTEMLLKIAEPAVRADAEDPADTAELMAVLRLDRRALELWASRGLRLAGYAAAKAKYGLK